MIGLFGGIVIALFNFLGASMVLVWRNPTEKWLDAALGFAAAVMLSASFTSLLLPGIEFASAADYRGLVIGPVALTGIVPVLIGFFLGTLVLDRGERWVKYVGPIISNRFGDSNMKTDGGEETHHAGRGPLDDTSTATGERVVPSVLGSPVYGRHHATQHAGGTCSRRRIRFG